MRVLAYRAVKITYTVAAYCKWLAYLQHCQRYWECNIKGLSVKNKTKNKKRHAIDSIPNTKSSPSLIPWNGMKITEVFFITILSQEPDSRLKHIITKFRNILKSIWTKFRAADTERISCRQLLSTWLLVTKCDACKERLIVSANLLSIVALTSGN